MLNKGAEVENIPSSWNFLLSFIGNETCFIKNVVFLAVKEKEWTYCEHVTLYKSRF